MKVWQAGTHLTDERGARVEDWTWAQTRRRLGVLVRLASPYKGRTALALVTLVAYTAVALVPPYLAKLAVDDGLAEGDLGALTAIVVVFLAAGVAAFVLSGAQTYFTGWVGERALADLRIKLFRHLQRLSLGYYERNRTGAIVSRITNDVEALDMLVTDGISSLVQNSLVLAGTVVVLFILDWRLALATLVVLPLMGLATAWFRSRSNRAYRRVRERLGLVTATLAEDISGMRVVQSFTREPTSQVTFRGVNDRYREANYETVILNGLYFPAVDVLSSVATAIVLGVGGWLVVEGELTIGTLLAFTLYLANFFDPVQQLSQLYNTFLSATAALDRITVSARRGAGGGRRSRCRGSPPASAATCSFESVTFGYGTLPDVLRDFDLDVPAGTTVALVGHTGAGKSTIAKLLARFYDPRGGRITIDGHDLRDVTQESLRRQLGIVPQEGFLFAGSIADNIAFGRPGASRAELETAASAVGVDSFVTRTSGRLRHGGRGAGIQALTGPAAAGRVRPRPPRRPAHPHPRRGDLVGGHRHRAPDRARAAHAPCRPHRVHHRPPALDDPQRGRDRRARPRPHRRDRHPRRAHRRQRAVHEPVRRLGGRGRIAEPHREGSKLTSMAEPESDELVAMEAAEEAAAEAAEAAAEARLTPAEAIAPMHLRVPARGNRKLRRLLERVEADTQIKAWWHVSNLNAVLRLQINDHSWVHIQIITNIALKITRLLVKHGVTPSLVRDYRMTPDDSEVVVVLAALLHDVGMSIHRRHHEDWSLFLAEPKMRELLDGIYDEPERTVVVSEALQAITSHRADGEPLSVEAGILRVADALDMAKGRSRIPFERGSVSIHSLSAAAIDEVRITDGESRPVMVEIVMNNSSGIYQVDGLLKAKLRGSGLEQYVEVVARIDTEAEKRLVPVYRLDVDESRHQD